MLSAAAFHAIVYAALTGTHIAVAVGAWVLANRTKLAPIATNVSAVIADLQTNAPMSQLAADAEKLAGNLAKLGITLAPPALAPPAPAPAPTTSPTANAIAEALDIISKKFHLVPRLDPAPTPTPAA